MSEDCLFCKIAAGEIGGELVAIRPLLQLGLVRLNEWAGDEASEPAE